MGVWDDWIGRVGAIPPVGYLLRDTIPERWFRIHNLPRSKRYPKTEAEDREVLRRNNAVATTVLGEASPCTLFVVNPKIPPAGFEHLKTQPTWKIAERWREDLVEYSFFSKKVRWLSGEVNEIILARARDEGDWLTFLSHATSGVYWPYDGGADLFLRTAEEASEIRKQFADWLSKHPKGL